MDMQRDFSRFQRGGKEGREGRAIAPERWNMPTDYYCSPKGKGEPIEALLGDSSQDTGLVLVNPPGRADHMAFEVSKPSGLLSVFHPMAYLTY